MTTLRSGLLGAGRIAEAVMGDLQLVAGAALHASGSRSLEPAQAFTTRRSRLSSSGGDVHVANEIVHGTVPEGDRSPGHPLPGSGADVRR